MLTVVVVNSERVERFGVATSGAVDREDSIQGRMALEYSASRASTVEELVACRIGGCWGAVGASARSGDSGCDIFLGLDIDMIAVVSIYITISNGLGIVVSSVRRGEGRGRVVIVKSEVWGWVYITWTGGGCFYWIECVDARREEGGIEAWRLVVVGMELGYIVTVK
ncbi:hypothetical protein Tco_1515968 [Tanacetum coccineum]